ncbi:FadR/GntR family transcriptional regulator [Devosia rhodophyticola]|uniref:FadR/GntR family transcriptional regulator n=1 Tax=Devosia rhodophyticola TaxID=3026423 RepID=A0ABY7Z0T1_9HYPH|nr:FadR/GntR family transcriptional regulator [Devosia rhodophyticola]WDR07236.1 FadR/GntR family transcriptional regulator [Devosia rhodophyticola]
MVVAVAPDRSKLHTAVVSAIEAQVLSGELKVGERLPSEAELSRLFAISTRSVREGLQILETKGLVRRRHGERAEIVRDDVDQFLGSLAANVKRLFAKDAAYLVQLMDVRRMFEIEVVGRLAAGEGELSQDVVTALGSLADAKDFAQYAEADANFHRALVHSLGNEILSSVYGNLYALITDIIRLTSRVPSKTQAEGMAEHQAIFSAIRQGDVDASRALIREHIDNSTTYLQQAINTAKKQGKTS